MKYVPHIILILFSLCCNAQEWQATYEEALTCAKDQDKPIVLVFSGSDWCAPCIKLEKDIWQSDTFKAYSKENYILYRADFPRKKANKLPKEKELANGQLAETFNPKGHFPLVVVLDREERVLGYTGYKKIAPTAYISLLNSFVK
ncbi:thioredoxin family protein [Spongiimicrobium sp. 3-5]|uniref:thioredoxin family protein n=1 Tax=Spongiimicrobium sp. 3-5 TaxID=3332596 RepID=UPI00397EEC4E